MQKQRNLSHTERANHPEGKAIAVRGMFVRGMKTTVIFPIPMTNIPLTTFG